MSLKDKVPSSPAEAGASAWDWWRRSWRTTLVAKSFELRVQSFQFDAGVFGL